METLSDNERAIFQHILDGGPVNSLIEKMDAPGVRINALDENGMNFLDTAAFKGDEETVQALIKKGVDVDNRHHREGYTALMFAAMSGNKSVCEQLLNAGARPDRTNRLNKTASEIASFIGNFHCSSVINSYLTFDEISLFLHPNGSDSSEIFPLEFVQYIHKITCTDSLHPVYLARSLMSQPLALKHSKKMLYVIDRAFERQLRCKEPNETDDDISTHSSEAAPSAPLTDFNSLHTTKSVLSDERLKLENKIVKIREKITKNSIAHESDIEQYLRNVNGSEAETAQMARLRIQFERRNKKYSQDSESLQRKLEEYEQRLNALKTSEESNTQVSSNKALLHSFGYGITKTGANLKEMAGTVMTAPLDAAQKFRRNVFGSADNIDKVTDRSSNSVGQSIFYDDGRANENTSRSFDNPQHSESATVHRYAQPEADYNDAKIEALNREVNSLRESNNLLHQTTKIMKRDLENDIKTQRSEITETRFKIQQLEQTVNETMELHQNEVKQLKNELTLIGTRMDYQYNDRFKKIEESVESAQNRMYRMETNWHENSERILGTGRNVWNGVMLSFANIIVETLKIVLYFMAVVLDSLKPLMGTRKRAALAVILIVATIWFYNVWFIEESSTVNSEIDSNSNQKTNERLL